MTVRVRPGARVLLLTPEKRFLLLHFEFSGGPLAGSDHWGVPGGGIDVAAGETPERAARRELFEETGLRVDSLGPERAGGSYGLTLVTGERVVQHDRYFVLPVPAEFVPSPGGLTPDEASCLAGFRWWSLPELASSDADVVPPELASVIARLMNNDETP